MDELTIDKAESKAEEGMNAEPEECLKRYRNFRPTGCDQSGLGLEDRQDWFVAPVIITRDSGVLATSNWEVCLRQLTEVAPTNEEPDYEVHRFGHWGPGWFEIILVRPGSSCAQLCADLACALSDYPILDENHYSEAQLEEANKVWKECYSDLQRLEYIREHRSQFEFHSFVDLLHCVRGRFFAGEASELIEDNGY